LLLIQVVVFGQGMDVRIGLIFLSMIYLLLLIVLGVLVARLVFMMVLGMLMVAVGLLMYGATKFIKDNLMEQQ